MIESANTLFEVKQNTQYYVRLAECQWEKRAFITDEYLDSGLFLTLGRYVIPLRGEMPVTVMHMFTKKRFQVISRDEPKVMSWEGHQSLIFEELGVFAIVRYQGEEAEVLLSGTFVCKVASKVVLDFDGTFVLPAKTAQHLRDLGYNLRLIEKDVEPY